jgi:cysteine desulfurase
VIVVGSVVYLDYNATAPMRPEALDAMLPVLRTVGNAASTHVLGRQSADLVATARQQVATLLHCSPGEIIFTSGATEANNTALRGLMRNRAHLITTAVEHPAVLETAQALCTETGARLSILSVTRDGQIKDCDLRSALADGVPSVVSIMAANNETGLLLDLAAIMDVAHRSGALVHTDATQLVGRLSVNLAELDVDALSLSAHKFGGPQGVGALFVRRASGIAPSPLLHGGGHEHGWRSGTLNVAGIVGAGAAAAAVDARVAVEAERVTALRDTLEQTILGQVPDARVNCAAQRRLPGVSSITFPGALADAVMARMPGVAVSDGSACASGSPMPSHVLLAMGLSDEDAESTIRFSLGYATTEDDVRGAAEATVYAVSAVRELLGYRVGAGT